MDDKIKAKENFSINKFDQNKTRTEIYEFNQETLKKWMKEERNGLSNTKLN
jgi:hypothetical protein